MAEVSAISWTDSTFNPWIGCTKVSPGCDHCYAEALDKRHRWKGAEHWGPGVHRMRTSVANWKGPLRWNARAEQEKRRWLVFCASLADVFDNEVPDEWRRDLWELIGRTTNLTWLLLTKRIGNASKMLNPEVAMKVWIGASIVNQEEADRDIPKLLATPAALRFVSYEPALGHVDWENVAGKSALAYQMFMAEPRRLDWIIVGGESSQGGVIARPFNLSWARSTVAQCRAAGVPCFVKQLGSRPLRSNHPQDRLSIRDRAGADPSEWPIDLRVQEFPV